VQGLETRLKANKCPYVIRTLREEGYNQNELNYLFNSIITIINYGLLIDVTSAGYITEPVNINVMLERQYKKIF
jgi:hypothetical protein